MDLQIQHEDGPTGGAFYIEKDGARVGEMTYRRAGTTITIDHTEVGDALRGQGAGKKLVDAGVAFARAQKLTIIPRCPYAKKVLEGDASYADVLAR